MPVIQGGVIIEGASRRTSVIRQRILKSAFTDGGGTSGTFVLTDTIPAGSRVMNSRVIVNVPFTGDVSAVINIGDGSDVDRYNTGNPSIFTAGDKDLGEPSGIRYNAAAVTVTLTVTSAADFTNVVGTGDITVEIWYQAEA